MNKVRQNIRSSWHDKKQLQDWLANQNFSHRIDIEPTPSSYFTKEEIEQRFSEIIFNINKRELGRRYAKIKEFDRLFYLIAFKQGFKSSRNIHYHCLLHTPKNAKFSAFSDVIFPWIRMPALHYDGISKKDLLRNREMPKALPCEDKFVELPLRVEAITSQEGSAIYNSRFYSGNDDEDFFIVGLPYRINKARNAREPTQEKIRKENKRHDKQFRNAKTSVRFFKSASSS
ncbi:hypothetical protein N9N21_01725 [Alphaproteobacteria bacterium]|nr:hypothetical protein [Alphaproteobacteria bacterium]